MGERVVVLGAGFGGLELSTMLSEASGGEIDVTLIDKSDSFVFGFSKLDLMFGREKPDAVRMAYTDIAKPGVRVLRVHRVRSRPGWQRRHRLPLGTGANRDLQRSVRRAGC